MAKNGPDNAALLAELARVKVIFQARAVAAAMGLPASAVRIEVNDHGAK